MKLPNKYIGIFFNFHPFSSHLYPLQVENCARVVVDEDDNGKFRFERVKSSTGVLNVSMCRLRRSKYNIWCNSQFQGHLVNSSKILLNPLSPHDALNHHFTSLKTDLISLQLGVLE